MGNFFVRGRERSSYGHTTQRGRHAAGRNLRAYRRRMLIDNFTVRSPDVTYTDTHIESKYKCVTSVSRALPPDTSKPLAGIRALI